MSWPRYEQEMVKKYERAGEELKATYDQLHRGKYAAKIKQREKFESLLEPLNKLVASQTPKTEPIAFSTPFERKVKFDTVPPLDFSTTELNDSTSTTTANMEEVEEEVEEKEKKEQEEEEEQIINSTLGPGAVQYMKNLATRLNDVPAFDTTFGIRLEEDGPYVGNSPIIVKNENIILPDGSNYPATPGLWELLLLNMPIIYTPEDKAAYGDILQKTHAYKRYNDPQNPYVKSNSGYKYVRVVREILNSRGLVKSGRYIEQPSVVTRSQAKLQQGSGLSKIFTGAPVEYVYWDSIEELLERLYILYGELKAGNTNPGIVNEIVNIIQEFKEL